MTSNMIYIVALGVGLKCPRKIHLNTQWGGHRGVNYPPLSPSVPTALLTARLKVGWNAPLSFDLTLVPIEI